MSETNKKEAGVQEETEKDLPETEPVTEPVEESPEATAGTETTELSTTCKIKDFTDSYGKIFFCFEHMFIPVESSRYGSCGIYNFILPVDYRLTELHIVDPFDNNKNLKKKKHFKYDVFYDCESHIQVVQMQLRSARGNFSFILTGEACIDDGKNKFIDCKEQNIYLDEDIREFFFDDGIKKSFWKNLKESILLEPNFNGIGIDLKKLFQK